MNLSPRPADHSITSLTTVPTGDRVLGDFVRSAEARLMAAGLPTPRAEARDLVAAVLERPRFWPSLHPGQLIEPTQARAIRDAVRRRAAGAPFAYAVGRAAFRFLTLNVDERVLIPRPETEQLVELVLATPQARRNGVACDVGTGSGAIALTLAAEGRFERVIGTDISNDALAVAARNAAESSDSLGAPVHFACGNGLAPLRGVRCDVLVSNPPYIAYEELGDLPSLVRDWEPSQALCCADDGLAVTRAIVADAPSVLVSRGLLALEVDSRRADQVAACVADTDWFDEILVRKDLTGRDRFVTAVRRPDR